jgi:ribokinase
MKPIVVVGSINMDLVSHAPRIPQAGETVIGSVFRTSPGGKGANQAATVARLGYPVVMLGALGEDALGESLLSTLQQTGVDTSHIRFVAGSSGTASIVVDEKGENCIVVTPGANERVDVEYLETKVDVLRSASMVLAQLEIPLATVQWLAECCTALGVPFMLDPAPAAPLPPSLLAKVTWFTPNETEAVFYAGSHQQVAALPGMLLAGGTQNVMMKRGAAGSTLYSQHAGPLVIPAFAVHARDTTGAGDAYNGALAVALARNMPVEHAARFAAATAALSVTREGAQASLPSGSEVESFLENSSATV